MALSVKSALRRQARQIRAAVPRAYAQQAAAALPDFLPDLLAACACLCQTPQEELRDFALYYPHGTELNCLPLLRALQAAGKKTALPVLPKQDSMIFRVYAAGEPLKSGAFGLQEPQQGQAITPQVILAPLLAFNAAGGRLGSGGGYYDRALAAMRAQGRRTALIGLGFSAQELPIWPAEPHDAPLNAVLTERGLRLLASAEK